MTKDVRIWMLLTRNKKDVSTSDYFVAWWILKPSKETLTNLLSQLLFTSEDVDMLYEGQSVHTFAYEYYLKEMPEYGFK